MKLPPYPAEQILGLRQKAVEEAERLLRERRLATERERQKLAKLKEERLEIDRRKAAAQDEFQKRLGQPGANIMMENERLVAYEKRCVVEAAAKDAEIRQQDAEVKRAESREQDAKFELNQRIKELEAIKEHKKEWEKETRRELEEAEERKLEEIGEVMHTTRERKEQRVQKERRDAHGHGGAGGGDQGGA